MRQQSLRTVCEALRHPVAVDFVRTTVKTGYCECFAEMKHEACAIVDDAFCQLQESSANPERLVEGTAALVEHTFKKPERSFWFNRLYHRYKTITKPEADFQQLKEMIQGNRVLDYGCGSGYLALRLAKGGYEVLTTDVLDYRYPEARHLPFFRMTSQSEIEYPEDSVDTALVQAVLHHVDEQHLPTVLRKLGRIAKYLLIKEDTYGLPFDLPGVSEKLREQPLLRAFVGMPVDVQYRALVLIDYYANAIAQGVPEMNMPFAFRTADEWTAALASSGLTIQKTVIAGFEPGRMHKSCHVWFLCRHKECPSL